MSYSKINWTNSPATPLDADNLNHMDAGIYDNAESVTKFNTRLNRHESYSLMYVTNTVTMIPATIYAIPSDSIATNAPVSVHITLGGGNSQLVRADGAELIDQLTNKVVDSTMTDIEITADDIIAGLKLTEGGTLVVKHYNKNCEDLFNRINNLNNSSYKTATTSYNTIETSNDFTVEEKEEIEV